jgi:hypothetical protein
VILRLPVARHQRPHRALGDRGQRSGELAHDVEPLGSVPDVRSFLFVIAFVLLCVAVTMTG